MAVSLARCGLAVRPLNSQGKSTEDFEIVSAQQQGVVRALCLHVFCNVTGYPW